MKHSSKVTFILVAAFFISQVVGLFIVNQYIDHEALKETGEVKFSELPYDVERPPVEESSSFWYIFVAILIGTALLLLIIKFRKIGIWKAWYFMSVFVTLTVALAAFLQQTIAVILALIGGYFKIFKPGVWLHNLTELLIYGGLAAIFVPIMNVFSAIMLLLLISVYDMYAVWKSKHMVKLAKFTTESKVFAGLSIPYNKSSGVVMKELMIHNSVLIGFLKALIIPVFTSIALYGLFVKGDKNKFYPAMPFLTLGCLIGYGIVVLII